MNKPKWLIIHHTGGIANNPFYDTSGQTFEQIDNYHRRRWDSDSKSSLGLYSAYHYLINYSGEVRQARSDFDSGWHTVGINNESLGVGLIGNFSRFEYPKEPSEAQEISLARLGAELAEKYDIPLKRIVPHRFFSSTACYGRNLTNDFAKDLVAELITKKKLLKAQISILERIIRLYVILLRKLTIKFPSFGGWHED